MLVRVLRRTGTAAGVPPATAGSNVHVCCMARAQATGEPMVLCAGKPTHSGLRRVGGCFWIGETG